MKRAIILALFGLMLAGCGGSKEYWCHPSKDNLTTFPKDRYECEGEAITRAKDLDQAGDEDVIDQEWRKCMLARGWQRCQVGEAQ